MEDHVQWSMGMPGGTVINAASSYSIHDSRRYRCLADNGGWFGIDPAFSYRGLQMEISEVRDGKAWKESPSIPDKKPVCVGDGPLQRMHPAQPYAVYPR